MGLTFTVGCPRDVFIQSFADVVAKKLDRRFSSAFAVESDEKPYRSDEVAWSGWGELQKRARAVLRGHPPKQLLSMEAWQGVYVPVPTEIGSFSFGEQKTPLNVACLPELIAELESFAQAAGLPADDNGLRALAAEYDGDRIDQDADVQTYAQLLLAAHEAARRRLCLWVVK
jgi:hypothetical protein